VILSLRQVSIPNFLEGLYLPLPHIEYHVDFFQSSAIIYYLLNTYDTNNKFSAQDPLKDEILTSFAGATLGPLITLELVLDLVVKHTPWPFVFFSRFLRKKMQNKYTRQELAKALTWLWKQLRVEEGAYFNGSEIGRSDVMLSWPLDLIAARNWYVLTSVLVWV
jgi:glutathione S-transferase